MFDKLKNKVIVEQIKNILGDNIEVEKHEDYYLVKITNPEFEVNAMGKRVVFKCPSAWKDEQN